MKTRIQKFLILSALLFCSHVGAQTWTTNTYDTVYIAFTVKMVSASWSIDTLGDGWGRGSTITSPWLRDSLSDSFWTDAGEVERCSLLVASYWLENTGGISLDIKVRASTGPDWHFSDAGYDCPSLVGAHTPENIGLNVIGMLADNDTANFIFAMLQRANIPSVVGDWGTVSRTKFFPAGSPWLIYPYADSTGTNLSAMDPLDRTDGTYRNDKDQLELYFTICPPPSPPTTSGYQFVVFYVKAMLAD